MPSERIRIAIIGAGTVGSTIAYAAMIRGLVHELVLIDVVAGKAEAEAKDLMHGSMFLPAVQVSSGSIADCRGAGIVVITAGAKQKPGQTRLDLIETNAGIFREMIPKVRAAAPKAILLIVSNPVDVLTYITLRLSELPPARVIGSGTVLDTSRFRSLLARRLSLAVANVHAYIVGEHGDSEVPLWSSAQVAGVPLEAFTSPGVAPLTAEDRETIFHNVRDAAAQVIRAKGATNWAVGLAVARILEALLRDERSVLTVGGLVSDYHGVDDVCLSAPRVVASAGIGDPIPLHVSDAELAALRRSAETLHAATRELGF
jgi:L-lactate dehydrogenase